jgi:Zn-dependent peptidase ImmA (M78 family)
MVAIPVNPKVLEWARTERRLNKSDAAKRLGISENDLDGLEQGRDTPIVTISLLRTIAAKYAITFASLLMPEPLPASTRPQVPDFRTHMGRSPEADQRLVVYLEDMHQQLEMLSDLKLADPTLFGDFAFPLIDRSDGPEAEAKAERERIGITIEQQLGWDKPKEAFRRWREAIEEQGIFVYTAKLGPRTNCRGFSVFDDRQIPVIVVNTEEDDYPPRIFTLLHEYCHILLREPGISDENRTNATESFCNQFAAYFLMPRVEFIAEATAVRLADGTFGDNQIGQLANRFKISKSAVALQLEDTGLASGLYEKMRALWASRGGRKGGGVVPHTEKLVNRLGSHCVVTVLDALQRGRINQLDAHEMLNVKPQYFNSVLQEARERRAAYGRAGR